MPEDLFLPTVPVVMINHNWSKRTPDRSQFDSPMVTPNISAHKKGILQPRKLKITKANKFQIMLLGIFDYFLVKEELYPVQIQLRPRRQKWFMQGKLCLLIIHCYNKSKSLQLPQIMKFKLLSCIS